MDKKDLREGIARYIEKYYEPEEVFSLKDEKVQATFSEIDNLRAAKSEEAMMCCECEDVAIPGVDDISDEYILDDLGLSENDPDKFDINTAEFTRIENPMSRMIVTGRSIDDLLGQMDETFSQRLLRMIRERDVIESEIYKKAYVDRRHFSKIKNDKDYMPNKKTVLAFCVALELTLDETKDLLSSAGYALSRSSKFDIIIVYFLQNKIYDMFEINEVLYEYEQPTFD